MCIFKGDFHGGGRGETRFPQVCPLILCDVVPWFGIISNEIAEKVSTALFNHGCRCPQVPFFADSGVCAKREEFVAPVWVAVVVWLAGAGVL